MSWSFEQGSRVLVLKARGGKPPRKGRVRVIVTRDRLDALRDAMARPLRVGLFRGITTIKDNLDPDVLRRAFMKGDYEGIRQQLSDTVASVVVTGLTQTVDNVATATIQAMPELKDANMRYNASNPRIQKYIAQRTGNLITTDEEGLDAAVKSMTTGALTKGMNVQQSAAVIRNSIGLNAPQQETLRLYREGMQKSGTHPDTIEAALSARSDTMLDYRAQMIALTEVRNAQNQGQLEVWQNAVEQEFIPKDSKKVWQIEASACEEWCEQMQGKAVELDEPWEVVKKIKAGSKARAETRLVFIPSEIHPNCACSQQLQMGNDE